MFADSAKYLAAAVEAANDRKVAVADLAKKHNLDAALLERWIKVLAIKALVEGQDGARRTGEDGADEYRGIIG